MDSSREPDETDSSPSEQSIPPFRLGPWWVEPSLHRITRRGDARHLEPRVMHVLHYLAQRPGEAVSRSELLREVWHGAFINEEALTRCVSMLRKALDDDPKSPRYIETIRKRGYCLLETPVFEPSGRVRTRRVRPGAVVALSGATLAVLALLLWNSGRPEPSSSPAKITTGSAVTPLTSHPGLEIYPALSPDGRAVAFAWNGAEGTNFDIYVKALSSESTRRLSDHLATEYSPSWSPEGSSVAFARGAGTRTGIYEVSSYGGRERQLLLSDGDWIHGMSWSPDGSQLAISETASGASPHHISLLDLESLERRRLTDPPPSSSGDRYPAFSPDGRFVAFVRVTLGGPGELFVVPEEGGEARQLTSDGRTIASLDWTPDGRALVFSSDRGGIEAIWRLPLTGGKAERLLPDSGKVGRLSVARHGGSVVYEQRFDDSNIWRLRVTPSAEATHLEKLIASTREDYSPSVSPDGERIVFVSTRSGTPELWLCRIDGSEAIRLTSFNGPYLSTPRWSPDGTLVAFELQTSTTRDIHLLELGERKLWPLTDSPADDRAPSFSADGTAIYFGSQRSGSWQIWRVGIDGGQASQVTETGGLVAFESDDDETLFIVKAGIDGLFAHSLTTGAERRVLSSGWGGEWGNWAQSSGQIFFVDRGSEPLSTIYRFDPSSGAVDPLGTIDNIGRFGLTVTPEGTEVLFAQVDDTAVDLVMAKDINGSR